MADVGEVVGGRYRLERRIGAGAMGTVFVALDSLLRRRVALKLMKVDRFVRSRGRVRFEREAMAIAQLRTPHVVQIYDFNIELDEPFIAMELLEGETLESRLARGGTMALSQVAEIVRMITRGLSPAHAAGIIHRDLKPANIFLSRDVSGEVVKILDFGIAAILDGDGKQDRLAGQSSGIIGTPQYMSPEQIRGWPVDCTADAWALGVIAFRLLTGRCPFEADNFGDLSFAICNKPAPLPSCLGQGFDQEVDEFFVRALAKKPVDRFQSVAELSTALIALGEKVRRHTARILVLDDEPDVEVLLRQRFRRHLQSGQYELLFASNGDAGLEALRQRKDVDLALVDIRMPGMDGLSFLRLASEVNPFVKIVMVSAYGDMQNIRQAMNHGAFDFLMKPIDFQDLEKTIEKCHRHAIDLRSAIRSTEENGILRLFVSGGVADSLVRSLQATASIPSERLEGTIAFIDVHGVNSLLDRVPPEAVFGRLNSHFEVIVPAVTARGGAVYKFLGDAIAVLFRGEGHLDRALSACWTIRRQVAERTDFTHGISIGIDSGVLLSGGVGSRAIGRLDHAMLGEPIGLAALLQMVGGVNEILMPESLALRLPGDFQAELVATEQLLGRTPFPVWRLVAGRPEQMEDGNGVTTTPDLFRALVAKGNRIENGPQSPIAAAHENAKGGES